MISNNYYPVKFKHFLRIKSLGNYIVMYTILDDRVHFEMPVENAVYVSQRFLIDIEEEIKLKAGNYKNDKVAIFLKMALGDTTFYMYYPTNEQIEEIKKIKLYNKIKVTETKPGTYNSDNLKLIETDTYMKAVDGSETIIFGEKE